MSHRTLKHVLPLLLGLAALKLVLHIVFVEGYGMFRDEFYYIACSERLAWGYVDHPPLSLVLLRGVRAILGDSLPAIRLLPAIAGAATVFVTGLMAREMRGGRFAVALAMVTVLASPRFLGVNHVYSMNCFELLFWAVAAYLLLRLCNRDADGDGSDPGSRKLWLLLGLVLGLGLLNKISVLWLGFGIAAGLLFTPMRRRLFTPWPWVACGLALLLFVPHLVWQASRGWPTLEFIRHATQDKMVEVQLWDFVTGQATMMNPVNLAVWLCGLVFFFGMASGRRYRILGWVYLAVFALLALSGSSRSGYLAPAYTWLMAGGAVALERWSANAKASMVSRSAALSVVLLGGLVYAPFGMPVLPVKSYIAYASALGVGPTTAERKELSELPQWYADMHGWEEFVATIAEVFHSLSADERERVAIFTGNYGEAGAIAYYGRRLGLPAAISGHNNYWLWGAGRHRGEVVIAIGGSREGMARRFRMVEQVAVSSCVYCMPYENGQPIFVGRDPYRPLPEIWDELKHYD